MSTYPAADRPPGQSTPNDGCVVAVRSAVVDVRFADGPLPLIEDELLIVSDDLAPVLAEVQTHLSETTVRALALQATAGLRRGACVRACGGPPRGAGRRGGARQAPRRHRRDA
jgi:F-type H+-transporting ATPase subunit beta